MRRGLADRTRRALSGAGGSPSAGCLADDVLLPLTGRTLRSNLAAPVVAGGLALEGEGLAFSAAMLLFVIPLTLVTLVVATIRNLQQERHERVDAGG